MVVHGVDGSMHGKGFHYCLCGEKFFMSKKLAEHIQASKKRRKK